MIRRQPVPSTGKNADNTNIATTLERARAKGDCIEEPGPEGRKQLDRSNRAIGTSWRVTEASQGVHYAFSSAHAPWDSASQPGLLGDHSRDR